MLGTHGVHVEVTMEGQINGNMIDWVAGRPERITLQPGQVIEKRLILIVVDHDKCLDV